MFTMFTTNLKI